MRILRTTAAALAAILLLTGCGAPAPASNGSSGSAAAKKTFTVGMECDYPPFNWTQVAGDDFSVALEGAGFAGGYDVMMAKTLADKMGATLVIKKLAWEGLEPAVTSGEIDAIIAGMTATPERKANADFTTPYYESEMVCIVRKDDPLAKATALADFTGKKVLGQQNTLYDDIIEQIPGVTHMTPMQKYPLMVLALQNGEADAITAELPVATGVITSNPSLAIVRFAPGKGFEADTTVSIAVKKGNAPLMKELQAALDTINSETRTQWMTDAVSRQPANG